MTALTAKIGIAPIAWWNDDLAELDADTSLEVCLNQVRDAGYTGMETGRRFSMDPSVLGPVLANHGISVCGGWYSGNMLDGDSAAEKEAIAAQMDLFKATGAPCIVYGEVARSIQGERGRAMEHKPTLSDDAIQAYARRMTEFAEWCADQGMPIAYHHHMGAVIQSEAELAMFMRHSGDALPLLFDTGHLVLAGADPLRVIDHHHARILHVHAKDVRKQVMDSLVRSRDSFLDAVVKGVFTVPGDGSLDFSAIVRRLADHGYEGWFVVEAEQDPKKHPPDVMAKVGFTELARVLGESGYQVQT